MAPDVYQRLAAFLDDLPAGYPRTESGAELRLLRRLFTPEEAEFAQHLSLLEEPARVVARRAKVPVEKAARILEQMERKGLIYAYHRPGKDPEYMATQLAIGFFEFQVGRLDADLVRDLAEVKGAWFDQTAWDRAPQLRTIPVGESISPETEVMPYERAEHLIRNHNRLAVAPCVCREEREIAGEGCDLPRETCLVMGSAATYYVTNGLGRTIDQADALGILAQAEEAELVLQPANAKDSLNICACCGCCCGILLNVKRQPRPASFVSSAFVAALNAESCTGCSACEDRCQMDAITLDNGYASLNLDRCIGCGLCVTTCPSGALSLLRKPVAEQPRVPRSIVATNIELGRARGKLTLPRMAGMFIRSKVDRLLAPK
jgi:Fe-S-cluster-containing hydrogenase component 2